jgi:CDP-diacylglycerol pyrophosphatase
VATPAAVPTQGRSVMMTTMIMMMIMVAVMAANMMMTRMKNAEPDGIYAVIGSAHGTNMQNPDYHVCTNKLPITTCREESGAEAKAQDQGQRRPIALGAPPSFSRAR